MKRGAMKMKKFFAVLLAVMLLPVFALAEETQPITVKVNDTLSLSVLIPDGYGFDQEWYGDMLYAQMNPEEEGKLLMVLSLGYSEDYADRSINDLSDEELDSLIAVSMSDFANPTYTLSETAEGTKLIIVDENSEHDEYAEVFTVYQGYFIGLLLEPAGDVQVSQEELDMAVQFLSDMQFVHTEA